MKNPLKLILILAASSILIGSIIAANIHPISKGVDLTGASSVTGSQLNQTVDSSYFITPYGFIIRTNGIPDTNTYPILTNCIWIDTRTTPAAICSWQTGSWVSATVAAGSIGTVQLQDLSVTSNKLAEPSVTTPKIKDRAIIASKLDYNAVLKTNIAFNQLINEHYMDGSITDAKLASSAVGAGKIAANVVAQSNLQANIISSNQMNQTAPWLLSNNIVFGQITPDKIDLQSSAGTKGQGLFIDTTTGTDIAWATPYCLQEVFTNRVATNIIVTVNAVDDTTMTTAESSAVFSVSITPKRSDTFLMVEGLLMVSASAADKISVGVFRDADAAATTLAYSTITANTHIFPLVIRARFASSSTAATTITIRLGIDGGTAYVNALGSLGTRVGGGTCSSWLSVKEVNM